MRRVEHICFVSALLCNNKAIEKLLINLILNIQNRICVTLQDENLTIVDISKVDTYYSINPFLIGVLSCIIHVTCYYSLKCKV